MRIGAPDRLAPGRYAVLLTMTDGLGAQLGARDSSGRFRGVRPSLGEIVVAPPATAAGSLDCDDGPAADASVFQACVHGPATATVLSGDSFTVDVTWLAVRKPSADLLVRLALRDDQGGPGPEHTVPLSTHPTSEWRPGDSYMSRYEVRTDPTLAPGAYGLEITLVGPDGPIAWTDPPAWSGVDIRARDRIFTVPDGIEHALDLRLGTGVRLLGLDLDVGSGADAAAHPGDEVIVRLYWLAAGPTDRSYTVFVQLLGPDGFAHGQTDRIPAAGGAPTTSWAPGQVIVDEVPVVLGSGAPQGEYAIAMGLYEAESGQRLPVTDALGTPLPYRRAVLSEILVVVGD
jgi:hypothetical protein